MKTGSDSVEVSKVPEVSGEQLNLSIDFVLTCFNFYFFLSILMPSLIDDDIGV
jgi:hypothetical protein